MHIDSKTLEKDKTLRDKVDTVGKVGESGEKICNVISVGMLSEGWDAKTVTQIMGLRAFTSQLLCEQVIGRGLRRTSYDTDADGKLPPEYVNVFGIPFEFLPCEDATSGGNSEKRTEQIASLPERKEFEITFPNVIRVESVFKPQLTFDIDKIPLLTLDATKTAIRADLAPAVDNKPDLGKCTELNLENLAKTVRLQQEIFKIAGQVYDRLPKNWHKFGESCDNKHKVLGTKYALLGQIIKLTEQYLKSGNIAINPPLFETSPFRRQILYSLNVEKIILHIWDYIEDASTDVPTPIIDRYRPVLSTDEMPTWYTKRPFAETTKSQINRVVCDSAWEYTEGYSLDKNPHVKAWAKNDHLGFSIYYRYNGTVCRYYPDFLVKLDNGTTLILETKGIETAEDKVKQRALERWVAAVNNYKRFGRWDNAVSRNPKDIDGIIARRL